jgi:hypothetical protein
MERDGHREPMSYVLEEEPGNCAGLVLSRFVVSSGDDMFEFHGSFDFRQGSGESEGHPFL